MTAGNTYLIRVSGYGGQTGTFVLNVTGGQGTCGGPCIPVPTNPEPGNRATGVPIETLLHWDNPFASCDCPESVNISSTILGTEPEDEEPADMLPNETLTIDRIADTDCYSFGGTGETWSGSSRLRGNVYTFDDTQTLTEIKMILGFTGSANLYYYVPIMSLKRRP
jgi:hypothetical protein